MVAVVSGAGLGLFGSSISTLGGAGAAGNAVVGRGNDRVFVNTATGNLIVQSQDERLSALGLDLALVRTYNSQGLTDYDNDDNWRLGIVRRVIELTGTINTAGSTVKKVFGDGREVLYSYVDSTTGYRSTEGDGAHDTLKYASSQWTWTDGSARNTETYNSSGFLTSSQDADGNTISYSYTGNLLTHIEDASGQDTYLDYSGNNLTQIRVVSDGATQTLTRYSYDGSDRLIQVKVDLTPQDNSVTDGIVHTTTYTYDGASNRIRRIVQPDASYVEFGYDSQNRVETYRDGEGRITTFTYSASSGGGSSSVDANSGALSTTHETTSTVTPNLNTAPLSTTEVQPTLHTYTLDTDELTETGTPPPQDVLHPGIPVSVTALEGTWKYYTIDVPADMSALTVFTRGGSGNADIYVRHGLQPTLGFGEFGAYSNGSTTNESLVVANPAAGTWYVGVYAAANISGVELQALPQTGTDEVRQLTEGVAITDISGDGYSETEDARLFSFEVAEGTTDFRLDMNGPNGWTFLYLKHGEMPDADFGAADYYSFGEGSDRSISVDAPAAGTWYVRLGIEALINDTKLVFNTNTVESAPLVDAGSGQTVRRGESVSLHATASDVQGAVSYEWTQAGGPFVTLANGSTANASFTAPQVTAPTLLTFQVKVTDSAGLSNTDLVRVFITAPVPSYTVQSGDTWASIAQTLYGTDAVASQLQTALSNPTLTPSSQLSGLPDTLSAIIDFQAVLQGGGNILHSGVAIKGIMVPAQWTYYTIEVPAGMSQLSISTRDGDGDLSLLAQHGTPPTWDNPQVWSNDGGTDEVIFVENPAAGTWYIGLQSNAWPDPATGVELKAEYSNAVSGIPELTPGEAVTGLSGNGDAENAHVFSFDIAAPIDSFRLDLTGFGHDVDMYVKRGSISTGEDTPYISVGPNVDESILVTDAEPGTWYVTVRGFGAYYDAKLVLNTGIVNAPPSVVAGMGQNVRSGAAVNLSASASDVESAVSYAWTQLSGTSVTLSGAGNANATFTAPTVTSSTMLTFEVTATDALGATDRDVVNVWVSAPVQSYTVQSGDTWASIALALYGTGAVASALQAALGNPTLTANAILTGLPAALSGNDIALQDSATELHNAVPVQNIAMTQWEWRYYTITVPSGTTSFSITPRNAIGTAYLYAREGAQPLDNQHDAFGYPGEPIFVANPTAGTWHIGIFTGTDVSELDLEVQYQSATDEIQTLIAGETVVDIAGSDTAPRVFSFEVPAGTSSLQLDLQGINGDPDIFLKRGSVPDLYDNDYASFGALRERIFVNAPQPGTWYIKVAGVGAFTDAKLLLSADPANAPPHVRIASQEATRPDASVVLNAIAGDAESALTYAWEQVGGPSVTLANGAAANASFTAPRVTSDTMLTFKVKVTDARGASDSDIVRVLVKAPVQVYTVQSGDTWASIAQQLYGTSAVAGALQAAVGNPALTPSTTLTNLPWTLSASIDFDIALIDGPTQLHNGVPIGDIAALAGEWRYYTIEVPAGATALSARVHGADSDNIYVYARQGTPPTNSEYDGAAYPTRPVFVANPAAGTWYVGMQFDADASDLELEAQFDFNTNELQELTPGQGVTGVSGNNAMSTDRVFSFEVPAGVTSFRLNTDTENPAGEFLTLLRRGAPPVFDVGNEDYHYDYWSFSRTDDGIHISNAQAGTWYVTLHGYDQYNDARITLNLGPDNTVPLVDAGAGQTVSRGATVNLTATGSDAESSVSYQWTQLSGPSVTLANGAAANASFTAPNVSTPTLLTFQVKATDARGATTTDVVRVFVNTSALAYVVQSGDTWSSIALALYGSSSLASQLQTALGNPALDVDAQLTNLPASLSVTTNDSVTVPAYYLIPSGATWRSIANTLYGVDSVEAGNALQTAMSNPALTPGNHLTSLPATLTVTTITTTTVPAYYTVQAGDTWASITNTIYGTSAAAVIDALQSALGNPTLSAGLELVVPLTLSYGGSGGGPSLETNVEDSLGLVTTYVNDSNGRLLSVLSPTVGGSRLKTDYAYDTDGNVTSITEDATGLNRVTTLSYDLKGNLLTTRDARGNTVSRTYDADNQLLTESRYVVRDPDGAGSVPASSPLTAHYIYDLENHLRFTISAQGRVTEHQYNTAGERTLSLQYQGGVHAGSTYTEGALSTWAASQGLTKLQRTEYAYDFRGNLQSITTYNSTNSSGVGTGTPSVTHFVYDQRGQLLQTLDARGSATTPNPATANLPYATTYTYDGLGRVLSTTQWKSGSSLTTTLNAYDDANRATQTTFANGLVTTQTFDRAGQLISVANGTSSSPSSLGTTTYVYDDAGRLRIQTDPNGNRQVYFYDEAGRKVGDIDGDGTLTEYIYDKTSRLIKTVQYAERTDDVASLVDGSGQPTSVTLSTLRTQANGTPAQNRIERSIYDAAGTLIYTIDAAGAVTQFFYDGAGRITDEVRYANTVSISATTGQVLESELSIQISNDDRRTRNFYDADGKLLGTLDSVGYLVEYVYDGAGYLLQQIGYATKTNATYWLAGTLEQLRPAADTTITSGSPEQDIVSRFFYDGQGRRIGVLDAEGYLTETVYDVAAQIVQTSRYDRALTYTEGTSTFQTLRTAALASPAPVTHTTGYQYDGAGQLTQETNHEGTVTTYRYDDVGNLVSSTRADGTTQARTTETRYDFLGRVIQELTAEGRAQIVGGMTQTQIDAVWSKYGVTYAYDAGGRRISATTRPNDSQTNTTLYFYDADDRLRFEANALGEIKENRYNALGQLTDSIAYKNRISTSSLNGGLVNSTLIARVDTAADQDADAHTTYAYTLAGRIESTTTAENARASYGYNAFGEQISSVTQIDAERELPHAYQYDKHGRLVSTTWGTVALSATETREYDAFGRLTRLTDARGNESSAEYDRLGRQIATVDARSARRTTTYDAFSRTLTTSDAISPANLTTYSYDDSARTMTVSTPEGVSVSTEHNRHGQALNVTAAGNTTTYSYNLNGQLTGTSDELGSLEGRTYDRSGRQLTQVDGRGTTTTFTYDPAARVLTRTVDSGVGGLALVTSYEYDSAGRVVSVTDPNGVVTATQYDRDGRVEKVIVDPTGLNLQTTYGYDRTGNVITMTEGYGSANPRTVEYTFDILGRRTQEVVDPGSGNLNLITRYRYDENGNVTRKIDARNYSTWYVYDENNRLIQTVDALGGVTQMAYDAEGRGTQTRRYATSVTTSGFGDSIAAQVVTPTSFDRVQRSFYDADGRERFTVDAMGGVTERTFDDSGNVVHERFYSAAMSGMLATAADVALAATESALDRQRWTAYDLRGQVEFSVDGTGAVTRYIHDPNGNVVSSTSFAILRTPSLPMDWSNLDEWTAAAEVAGDPENRTTRFWYDAVNREVYRLDSGGYLTQTQYDDANHTSKVTLYANAATIPVGATLQQIENETGGVAITPELQADQSTETQYDAAGRIVKVTDATGNFDIYGYDEVGNKVLFTNKSDATWTYVYDANRRLIEEQSPELSVTTVGFSGSSSGYGGTLGRDLASTSTTAAIVTRIEYDALGNVVSRKEAYGTAAQRTTSYEYDALGRQTRINFPTVFVYSPEDDDLWTRDYLNVTRDRGYWLEKSEALYSQTTYDALGNATDNRDVGGGITHRLHDQLGRVRYVVDAELYVTEYRYDTFGNQTELVRYANALDIDTENYGSPLSLANLQTLLEPDAAADRAIATQFDLANRVKTVTQTSTLVFEPAVGETGGGLLMAGAQTVTHYNAQGQPIKQSTLVSAAGSGQWADTYFYYDTRGLQTAQVDALGYVTTYDYDASGNRIRQTEYAKPLQSGAWNIAGHATPDASTTGAALGSDRVVEWDYDLLNRKIAERRKDVSYSSASGTTITAHNDHQITSFGYDAVGNQTRVTDANGTSTYIYYDALGRQIATAAPSRDLGDGTLLTPLTRMRRDAFGNLVEQITYAQGASHADEEDFGSTSSGEDRTTRMLVDVMGNIIQTQDASGANHYASYTARGEVAREWQPVDLYGYNYPAIYFSIYGYDRLGRRTSTLEPRYVANAGYGEATVTSYVGYNAFGEATNKSGEEYFEYDQAGRIWRTNTGDGVYKIYLYNLAGQTTAEIKSQTLDLSSYSAQDAAALTSQRMRTETRYDLLGRVVEQRQPEFLVAHPQNELQVIGTQFEVDNDVLGPSNPDAVYTLETYDLDLGYGSISYSIPTLNPSASVGAGGGYYYVAPTAVNAFGGWAQDTSYGLVAGRYIHWARPEDYTSVYGMQFMKIAFEYRTSGSSGEWTTLRVVSLPDDEVGVDLSAFGNGSYDYRVRYTRADELNPYALATGTVTIGSSSVSTVDTTLATLAAGNLTPTSIVEQVAVNTQFRDAQFAIVNDTGGLTSLDGFVYRRVYTEAGYIFVTDRRATLSENGGYYLTASGYVKDTGYDPATSRAIRWNIPSQSGLTPVFQYRVSGSGNWQSLGVATVGSQYAVAIGELADEHYEFRVTYSASGNANPVATANGNFTLAPADVSRDLGVTPDPADEAGTVAPIGNRPPGSLGVTAEIAASAHLDSATEDGLLFSGNNDVVVKFPSISGPVRVELEYATLELSPQDDPGPTGTGWASQSRHVSLLLSSAATASSGLHIVWRDPIAAESAGGIQQVVRVRVYSIAADGTATLSYASDPNDAVSMGGTSLSWHAPWDTSVTPTFRIRKQGTSTWETLTVSRTAGDFTVNVASLGSGEWQYDVEYVQGEIQRAHSQGTFVLSASGAINIPEDPGSGPYPMEPVAPVAVLVAAPLEFSVVSSAEQIVTDGSYDTVSGELRAHRPLTMDWVGENRIDLAWADIGTGNVRVEVDYNSAPRYGYNYTNSTPPHWEETPAFVAGTEVTKTFTVASGAQTGTSLTWSDDTGNVGGVRSINRVRVYTLISGEWVLKYDRDAQAPHGGTTLYWSQPDDSTVNAAVRVRPVGSSTWQTLSLLTTIAGYRSVDLSALTSATYEYQIEYSVTASSVTTSTALAAGTFTIDTAGSSAASSRLLGVTQSNVTYDRGANSFGPVAWNGANLSWSFAPQAGDSIVLRTRVAGSSTWTEQSVTGSSGTTSVAVTVAANQALEYEIAYTASGGGAAYAQAGGTLNRHVATVTSPATISIKQTNDFTTSIDAVAGLSTFLGVLSWTTQTEHSNDIVTLRYQLPDNSWTSLPIFMTDDGYVADTASLAPGVYQYQIVYKSSSSSLPYAFASGEVIVGGAASGGGARIEDKTRFWATVEHQTGNVPTQHQTLDRWGNVLSTTDVSGNTTTYRYNELGQLIEAKMPQVSAVDTAGGTLATTNKEPTKRNYYDLLGRLIATADANENVNAIQYNDGGQIIAETHADGGEKEFLYDAFGNQTQVTDELGYRTRNTYDASDRLTSVEREVRPGGFESEVRQVLTDSYLYDVAGNRIKATNAAGEQTRYGYDLQGNVTSRQTDRGFTYFYEYDDWGNKISESNPNYTSQSWTYNYFGRLISHDDLGQTHFSYQYDNTGLLALQVNSQGQRLEYKYDAAGHVSRILDRGRATSEADVVNSNNVMEYGYDIAGRRVVERSVIDGRVQQNSVISYDALGRMTRVEDPDYIVNYSYDAAGNRTHIVSEYFDHSGYGLGNRETQDLWYTYDAMNRVLVSQGVLTGSDVDISAAQGTELAYDLKGQRISARQGGKHMQLSIVIDGGGLFATNYQAATGIYTERYGYDGLSRLESTDQDAQTVTYNWDTGQTTNSVTAVRTNTKIYDAASRQISDETYSFDVSNPASLTHLQTLTTYTRDGLPYDQWTKKNGKSVSIVRYGDAVYVAPREVAVNSLSVIEYVRTYLRYTLADTAMSSGSSSSSGSVRARAVRNLLVRPAESETQTHVPSEVVIPGHWTGLGYDSAGVLRGYRVETYRPSDGKFMYATEYKLSYRMAESAQLIVESAHSFTTVHNISIPGDGRTTRTYDVNGALVSFTDSRDSNKDRYFANDALGQTLAVVQGRFDGVSGRLSVDQAFDNAVARTGNQVKAQYFFSANGQTVGSFGQLTDTEGAFRANFDVNYTPISASYPGRVPTQLVVQQGDTLRSIAARVFGDASLWYVIAEENGLTDPDASLNAGTLLRIPNDVVALSNNATTFKPFDVNDAIGDMTPTQPFPKPKKGGCGVIGQILIIIVAIVVTIYTAGAAAGMMGATSAGAGGTFAAGVGVFTGTSGLTATAAIGAAAIGGAVGSAVSQGVAIAAGMQEGFDWTGVAMGAIGAGVTAGLAGSAVWRGFTSGFGLASDAVNAAGASVLTQGMGVLTGVQDHFSWREVAISAVAAPIAGYVGAQAGALIGSQFASRVASSITGSLVRAAFGGKIDATSVLVDAFGNAIGNSIVDTMQPTSAGELTPHERRMRGEDSNRSGANGGGSQWVPPEPVIESPLDNNPDFFANLPMPTAEFEADMLGSRNPFAGARLVNSYDDAIRSFVDRVDAGIDAAARAPQRGPYIQFDPAYQDQQAAVIAARNSPAAMLGMSESEYGRMARPTEPPLDLSLAGGAQRLRDDALTVLGGTLVGAYQPIGQALDLGELAIAGTYNLFSDDTYELTGFSRLSYLAKNGGSTGEIWREGLSYSPLTAAPLGGFDLGYGIATGDPLRAVQGGLSATLNLAAIGLAGPASGVTGSARAGLRTSAEISAGRAETFLVKHGVDPEIAKSYVASFDGPITARIVRPGEEFLRYTDYSNSTGSFLTKTEFPNPPTAAEGLYLKPYNNNANYVQVVTSNGRTIVLEGGIAKGAAGVRQTVVPNRSLFNYQEGRTYP